MDLLSFVDDTILEGKISQVANDVKHIESRQHTGLCLNAYKCQIIVSDFKLIGQFLIFKDFKWIAMEN